MNKITLAILLLINGLMYSAEESLDDWINLNSHGELIKKQPPQSLDDSNQPSHLPEASGGCCAVVIDVAKAAFDWAKKQAYGHPQDSKYKEIFKAEEKNK